MVAKHDIKSRKDNQEKLIRGKISIGVPTRQRPEMLEQCLRSLTVQAVPDGMELVIVVVENDPEPSSRGVVDAVEKQSTIPIEYHIERRIGLASVRNTVLDAAIANGSDYLAFIDDDELAYPEWVSRLHAAVVEHGAMMAGGAVNRIFECTAVPAWAAQYYRPTQSEHGGWPKVIPGALPTATHNLFFDLSPARERGIRFDVRFNLTSGEDTQFISDLAQATNGKSIYVNDAIVCEVIPASRMTRKYIFKRNVLAASHEVRIQRGQRPGFGFVVQKLFSGMGLMVLGGFFFALTYFVNGAISAIWMLLMSRGIGILSGLLGYQPRLYAQVTGN